MAAEPVELIYPGFTLWYDCAGGRPLSAYYLAYPDTGNEPRSHDFHPADNLPPGCRQQHSTNEYTAPADAPETYDRGHLVPANHLDHDPAAIYASNVMVNIVPQQSSFNRTGAWRATERLIECWRDRELLAVWIGVIWGDNAADDYFLASHGIETPDAFVKIVYSPSRHKAIAWRLPNAGLRTADLPGLVVPVDAIEREMGWNLVLDGVDKTRPAAAAAWPKLSCDQG